MEIYSDFKNLARVNQHDLKGFKLKISKKNYRRKTILVMFCINESVALIISNVANVFTKLNPSKGI